MLQGILKQSIFKHCTLQLHLQSRDLLSPSPSLYTRNRQETCAPRPRYLEPLPLENADDYSNRLTPKPYIRIPPQKTKPPKVPTPRRREHKKISVPPSLALSLSLSLLLLLLLLLLLRAKPVSTDRPVHCTEPMLSRKSSRPLSRYTPHTFSLSLSLSHIYIYTQIRMTLYQL